jgi:hypothetical protein
MSKPNIQIDDIVREMTDEEYEEYETYRTSSLAKQAALGLTEEEIAAP